MTKVGNLTLSLQLDSANLANIMGKLAIVANSDCKDARVQLVGEISELIVNSVSIKPGLEIKLCSIDEHLKRIASNFSILAKVAESNGRSVEVRP